MIRIGDYVGVHGRGYEALRGIIVAGPRIAEGTMQHTEFRVKWFAETTPRGWNPPPKGSWEPAKNIKILSSLETRWV